MNNLNALTKLNLFVLATFFFITTFEKSSIETNNHYKTTIPIAQLIKISTSFTDGKINNSELFEKVKTLQIFQKVVLLLKPINIILFPINLLQIQKNNTYNDNGDELNVAYSYPTYYLVIILFVIALFIVNSIKNETKELINNLNESKQKTVVLEEKFRSLIEHATDAIFMITENGIIFDVNFSATKLLNYTKKEFIGYSILNFKPANENKKVPSFWDNLKENKAFLDVMFLQRKDGTKVEVEININFLPNETGAIAIVRDITERNAALNLLKESEDRISRVLHNSPIPFMLMSPNDSIVLINSQFTEKFGYEINDIPNLDFWWNLAYPNKDYRNTIKLEWFERINKHKETLLPFEPMEAVVSCKSGLEKHIEYHFTDIGKEILISFYDITDRKDAEKNLKQSEERHRALVENIDDCILVINENLNVIYQSPSVERIIGYTIDDRKGKVATDYIHPDDKHICVDQYAKAKANPGLHTQSQYRTRHKKGHYIWIDVIIVNLLHNESIKSYIIIYKDITESKKYEEQQLLLSSIVNYAIISKTTEGVITSWNLGAEKVLGYNQNEMIGENIYKIIPSDLIDEEVNVHQTILNGNAISHFETKRIRKDGQVIDVSVTVSPIKDTNGKVVGASKILRDISDWKKAENQLKEHNEKLSEIAFLQSHIVRRPVANVLGIINLLNKQNPTDPMNIEMIPLLETAAKELDEVIYQIVEKTKEIS